MLRPEKYWVREIVLNLNILNEKVWEKLCYRYLRQRMFSYFFNKTNRLRMKEMVFYVCYFMPIAAYARQILMKSKVFRIETKKTKIIPTFLPQYSSSETNTFFMK